MLLARRRLVRFVEPGSRVLDAGCGDGTMAFLLHHRGCRVVGVSDDAAAMAGLRGQRDGLGIAEEHVDFQEHDLRQGTPPGAPFDAALCFDVLEHIRDDGAALAGIAAAVREGGRVLITVPDRAARPLRGDTVSASEDGGHVRQGYTREELESLLRHAGLEAALWRGFGGFFAQKGTNVSRRLEAWRGTPALVLRVAWLAGMRLLACLDPLLPYPAYEHFVLAEKR